MGLWNSVPKDAKKVLLNIANPSNIKASIISSPLPTLHSKIIIFIDEQANFQEDDLRTFAESFRQTLLTQVEGFACTHLKIQTQKEKTESSAILHKYGFLEGMIEPVRDMIHNLQRVIFKLDGDFEAAVIKAIIEGTQSPSIEQLRAADFRAGDDETVIILNPDQIIGHINNKNTKIILTLHIQKGISYHKAKESPPPGYDPKPDKAVEDILLLPLDADFNPVNRVSWKLDPTTPSLIFSIETKGNVTPEEAYQQAWNYLKKR